MNSTIISGNIATDIEKRTTQSGISQCSFRVAVQRRFKDQASGKREADFLQVVTWRQQADFLAQYAAKGDKVTVKGAIQTRTYEKDGVKHFITEINADEVELDKKRDKAAQEVQGGRDFTEVADDGLPF